MKIAIIGTGNVGGALATKWANKGHLIFLGTKDINNFKGKDLLANPKTSVHSIQEAVQLADVILMSVPAIAAIETTKLLGNTEGKIIIDSMNIVMNNGPAGFSNTSDAILANTQTKDVVKCFNTTGFNNIENPDYKITSLDLFVAGDSTKGKEAASQLALDAGFANCYDVGGNNNFTMMEQFAWFWINLAMVQRHGRDIGFKLLKR